MAKTKVGMQLRAMPYSESATIKLVRLLRFHGCKAYGEFGGWDKSGGLKSQPYPQIWRVYAGK